jgi:hypothetical protein
MVEKLQELRNLRIQKLKKQGINAGFLLLTWIHTHTHTHTERFCPPCLGPKICDSGACDG